MILKKTSIILNKVTVKLLPITANNVIFRFNSTNSDIFHDFDIKLSNDVKISREIIPIYIYKDTDIDKLKTIIKTDLNNILSLNKYQDMSKIYELHLYYLQDKNNEKIKYMSSSDLANVKKIRTSFSKFMLDDFLKENFSSTPSNVKKILDNVSHMLSDVDKKLHDLANYAKEIQDDNSISLDSYISRFLSYLGDKKVFKSQIYIDSTSIKNITITSNLKPTFFKEDGIFINTTKEKCISNIPSKTLRESKSQKVKEITKN